MSVARTLIRSVASQLVLVAVVSFAKAELPSTGSARDSNFSVYAESPRQAQDVLDFANEVRESVAKEWFGETIPDGFGPTSLNIRITEKDQSLTWLMEQEGPRTAHTTWVYTTPDKLYSSLTHEVAHTVLWCRYPNLPAFAQEGVASSYDGPERAKVRRETIVWFTRSQRWPRLNSVLSKKTIAPTDHAKYAVASSLTAYLLELNEGDKQGFLRFANEGAITKNWDAALQKHYSIPSVASLQSAWQKWAIADLNSRRKSRN